MYNHKNRIRDGKQISPYEWLLKTEWTIKINKINKNDILNDLPEGTKGIHKRAFPLKLVKKLITCFPNAQTVYDPYMGSGTTALAAQELKRNWIGSEISPEYCRIAETRINKRTNQIELLH